MPWWELVALNAVTFTGAIVQGGLGVGINLVCVPVFLFAGAALVPGPALVVGIVGTAAVVMRSRTPFDLTAAGWATAGRLPGIAAGLAAIAVLDEPSRVVIAAALVIVGVASSATSIRMTPTPPSLVAAGAISGLMSVLAALGGPPMALLYQRERPADVRSALATFALVSGTMSLATLVLVGRFGRPELSTSLLLLPGVVAGAAASSRAVPIFDRRLRALLLGFSLGAAALLLAKQLVS